MAPSSSRVVVSEGRERSQDPPPPTASPSSPSPTETEGGASSLCQALPQCHHARSQTPLQGSPATLPTLNLLQLLYPAPNLSQTGSSQNPLSPRVSSSTHTRNPATSPHLPSS